VRLVGAMRVLVGIDAWLTPTLSEPPVPLGEIVSTPARPQRAADRSRSFLGRFGDEAALLRLASQLEQARPWAGSSAPAVATLPAGRYPKTEAGHEDPHPPRRDPSW
jgi:amidase